LFWTALVLVAAHGAAWVGGCVALERGLREAEAAARTQDWTLSSDEPRWSGWPLAAELVVPRFVATAGPSIFPPGLIWRADEVHLRLSPWAPTTLVVAPAGPQTVEATGIAPVPLGAAKFAIAIPLTAPRPTTVEIAGLTLRPEGAYVTVATAHLVLPADAVTADLDGVTFSATGPPIDHLHFEGTLTEPIPPLPTPEERAVAWRDAGGKAQFTNVTLRWGQLEAHGTGTLELDAELQPRADLTLTATGARAWLDSLARTGALSASAANAIKAVIAILAAPAPGAPITVPVTLRNGVLEVARFPLLRLAPLVLD
jgi:hypothetical protein